MKYRLADEPQKIARFCSERTELNERFGALFKNVQRIDTVPETENQTAGNNRRNQRSKNFRRNNWDIDEKASTVIKFNCRS